MENYKNHCMIASYMHHESKKLEGFLAILALVLIGIEIIVFLNEIVMSMFIHNFNSPFYENLFFFLNQLKELLFRLVIIFFILFATAKISEGFFEGK